MRFRTASGIRGSLLFTSAEANFDAASKRFTLATWDTRLYEGMPVTSDGLSGTNGTIYDIRYIDNSFQITDANGRPMTAMPDFSIIDCNLDNLLVCNAASDGTTSTFQLMRKGEPEAAKMMGTTTSTLVADVEHSVPVVGEWYTPMLDLGANEYVKKLTGIGLTAEPYVSGKIKLGYLTYAGERALTEYSTRGFSFEDMDFEDFTFVPNNFAASYRKKVFERRFNYVMFRVISDEDSNCAIHSISAEYVMLKKFRGVQ